MNADRHRAAQDIERLIAELLALRSDMVVFAETTLAGQTELGAGWLSSARNLLHYLSLRRHDLRHLQPRLAALGYSSLGRAEAHVLPTLDSVLASLHDRVRRDWPAVGDPSGDGLSFEGGRGLLARHAEELLGKPPAARSVRIMVTAPSEAADDDRLVHRLLEQGMDCMRINCAHDDAVAWGRMIEHLRRAERALGRSCRLIMDLGGPKLRTGPIEPGAAVVKCSPVRDELGRVRAPARIWLTAQEGPAAPPAPAAASLPVPRAWLASLESGDRLQLEDARGSDRSLRVVDVTRDGCWAESRKTAYIVPGTRLRRAGGDAAEVGPLPRLKRALLVQRGDRLLIQRDLRPGRPASHDSRGRVLTPASIGCTLPEVFEDVRAGERVWLDDGRIGGVIERVDAERVTVRITQARPEGERLRSDKGINLPDSALSLSTLTAQDLSDLGFVAQHADMVALSFAGSAGDVEQLREQMERLGGRQPAIVLKIETRRGFEQLPAMLLAAMRAPGCGVMIARGDLAVECGFERLAEVQEEILWICEAAHVPAIWATQVLENLAKDGRPSRAEITDAAMGERAECVMLNKGPHITAALSVLDDILSRMQAHQAKKSAKLRPLRLAQRFSARHPRAVTKLSALDAAALG